MDLIEVREVRMPRERGELRFGPRTRALGGGTWLYSEPQPGVDELLDLTAMGWPSIARDAEGALVIAATCTVAELAELEPDPGWGAGVDAVFRVAAEALVASWKVWHSATVGGNLCTALPAGAMTSLLAGLDAEALVWQSDGGERRVPVAEFVTGVRTTVLAADEVLREVRVPPAALAARVRFRRAALAPLGRSGAVVVARADVDGGFAVTVTASTTRPHALRFAQTPDAAELAAAIEASVEADGGWYDDVHGAPDWRRARTLAIAEELRRELAVDGEAR